jgi:hypothetical protein
MDQEEFSDVEEGEEPYYPETDRIYVTTTRSGRKVFAPQRLVVDPYITPPDDDDGISIHEDSSEDGEYSSDVVLDDEEEDPEADYMPTDEESEDESESDESDETPPMTPPSLPSPTVSLDQGERSHTN